MNAVLNHLWQSTAFALLAPVVAFWLRPNRAHVRYRVWLAASIKFLIPFSILINVGNRLRPASHYAAPAILATAQSLGEPFTRTTGVVSSAPGAPHGIALLLLGVWMCGLVVVLAVWCRRWLRAIATLRSAEPFESEALTTLKRRFGISVPVRLVVSDSNLEPGVFGVFQPVVIIPTGLRDKFAARQLESVIAHELCHIRRLDNLAALIHMLVEAVFWFHPLMWWIGARLLDERERACDEAVLELGADPEAYAESILKICEHYLQSSLACVAGVTGSDLKKRMERIMNHRLGTALSLSKKMWLGLATVVAIAAPLLFGLASGTGHSAASTDDWQKAAGGKMRFEVASVRSNPGPPQPANFRLSPDDAYGNTGGLLIADMNLASYIVFAYKLGPLTREQFHAMYAHLPNWVRTDNYEIRARAETTNPTKDQMRLMMQSLLKERFGLIMHYEQQDTPVLEMTLKNPATLGPQLRRHEDGPTCDIKGTWEPGRELKKTDIFPSQCDELFEVMPGSDHTLVMGARDATMESIAKSFGPGRLGRPVVDATGLTGKYDFTLQWTPNAGDFGYAPSSAPPDAPTSDSQVTPFLDAVKEQLGFKLKPGKAMLKVLVIDHVERPSEN